MKKSFLILTRIFSAVLDIFIYSLLMLLFKPILIGDSEYYSGGLFIITYYLFFLIQDIIFNRTIGKLILGLKIIYLDNDNYRVLRLFLRRLFDLLELVMPFLYLFFIVFNKESKKLGDLLSKTKIIKTKSVFQRF